MIKNNFWQIFTISFVFLFLELLLIRLISTEIRIFAYMSNLVLLAIFSGAGLGMLFQKGFSISWSIFLLFILELILSTNYIFRLPNLEFKLFSGITELLAPLSEAHLWLQIETFSKTGIVIGLFLMVSLLLIIGAIFFPIGQYLGKKLNQSPKPLLAYSVNVLASILGMWVFHFFSYFGLSPYLGLFLGQTLLFIFLKEKWQKLWSGSCLLATMVLLLPRTASQPYEKPTVFWSPYQKLTLSYIIPSFPYQAEGWYLETNNVGYMALLNLSSAVIEKKLESVKEVLSPLEIEFSNIYSLPFQFLPEAKNVLIIGGGAGNDAAAALKAGLKDITVVEIDPTIIRLGKKYHPEKPYTNHPEVKIVVDDGRAFLQRTKQKYDIIIMSLADSHTLSSSLANLRLDNYLYTQESLTQIKSLLTQEGLLFLSFEVGRPWIGGRLQKNLSLVFQQQPLTFEVRSQGVFGWGGTVFVNTKNSNQLEKILKTNKQLKEFIEKNKRDYPKEVNPSTDDWPYLYLDQPRLPLIHLLTAIFTLGGILLLSLKTFKKQSFQLSFFFLGIAFMLFEFQNISKSSLIFGTTWITNLFIITGILIFILAANLSVAKKFISLSWAFIFLFLSLSLNLSVPLSFFNQFEGILKLSLSLFFLCLPHFFSGIIFASLFQKAKDKSGALGSNFLGSVIGGTAEMFSFLWGINALLYLVILFYFLGLIFSFPQKLAKISLQK